MAPIAAHPKARNDSGGDSVGLGVEPLPPTSCDLFPHRQLSRNNSAWNKLKTKTCVPSRLPPTTLTIAVPLFDGIGPLHDVSWGRGVGPRGHGHRLSHRRRLVGYGSGGRRAGGVVAGRALRQFPWVGGAVVHVVLAPLLGHDAEARGWRVGRRDARVLVWADATVSVSCNKERWWSQADGAGVHTCNGLYHGKQRGKGREASGC